MKLRGETSSGMILSERELDLGTDHSGIMVLEDGPEPGTPLADVLPLSEQVLEIETTPNRPDLLSIYGLAREVAAIFGGELRPMPGTDPDRPATSPWTSESRISSAARATSAGLSDVGIARRRRGSRLIAAGMRPISNVVDATNYVMLAWAARCTRSISRGCRGTDRRPARASRRGDPDARRHRSHLDARGSRDRRRRTAGCDRRGHGRRGQRGHEETTVVLLEAANFEPSGIQRTSERLGLRSEASGRWEKGVDPHLAEDAARLSQLFGELAGAGWTGESDVRAELPERPVIHPPRAPPRFSASRSTRTSSG